MQAQEIGHPDRAGGTLWSWLFSRGSWPASRALPAAVVLVAGSFALDLFLPLSSREALNLFLLPMALSAYLGGLGAGLFAMLLIGGGLAVFSPALFAAGQETGRDKLIEAVSVGIIGLGLISLIQVLQCARRRAAAVPRLEQQIARIASSAPGILFSAVLHPDGTLRFPFVSPSYVEIIGEPIKGLDRDAEALFALIHPDDRPAIRERIAESAARLSPFSCEMRLCHPTKGEIWLEARSVPRAAPDGCVVWQGFAGEITGRKQAEAALRESEERYRHLFEASGEGIALTRISDTGAPIRFVQVNETLCRRLGYSREELLAKDPQSIVMTGQPVLTEERWRHFDEGGSLSFTNTEIARDGHRIETEVNLRVLKLGGEKLVLATSRDISERQRARETLEARERRYRALFDLSPAGVLLEDALGNILEANDALAEMIGVSKERLIGGNVRAFVHESELPRVEKHIEEILAGRTLYHEVENVSRDGNPRYMELRETAVELPDGTAGILSVVADVTSRRRMEAALRESEARYRATLDEMIEGCQIFDRELRYHYVNESAARQRHRTPAELMGRRVEEVFPGIAGTSLHAAMLRTLNTGEAVRAEHLFGNDDGSSRWFEVHMHLVPEGLFVLSIDITERRESEERLRQSEERFRILFDRVAKLAVQGYGPDGTVRFWNSASEQLYGYSAQEAIGRNLVDLIIPPAYRELVRAAVREMAEEGVSRPAEEILLMRKDGSLVPVFSNHAVIDVAGRGREIYCIDIDLTEQKRAQAGLRLQSAALAAAANAIAITDFEGMVEWVNPAFTAITGYTPQEAVGGNLDQLLRLNAHPEAYYERIHADIRTGKVWSGDVINRRKDGLPCTVAVTITPLRDDHGAIEHFIVIKQDVTEQRRLEAQLLRTQRLESVGRLASGIAHDLNNILMPMMLGSSVLRAEVRSPAALAVLDSIETSAQRGSSIIKQLLTFGRGLETSREPVSLRLLVREMMKLIQETFPKNIEARAAIPEELPMVEGDITHLHQVLMNLCVNARDAMPSGGKLNLALSEVTVDEARVAGQAGAQPGRHVVLTVTDTGTGIPPEVIDKIFDPFFSTKAVGEGTGLGLSTVLGLVRSHKGFIEVESRVGRGTEFRVFLPASQQRGKAEPGPATTTFPKGSGETVLVVDDEDNVRVVARRMLEFGGYSVLEARHGAEALELLEARHDCTRVVLTDIVMPVMDGPALIGQLRKKYPALKIVSMSGYIAQPGVMQALEAETEAFLPKPFGSQLLLSTLHTVLRS